MFKMGGCFCTYSSIADDYASFTVKFYAKTTVVFDGYGVGPSIKDNAHQHRNRNTNACEQGKYYRNEPICWKNGFLVKLGKYAGNYPAHDAMFITEELWGYPS